MKTLSILLSSLLLISGSALAHSNAAGSGTDPVPYLTGGFSNDQQMALPATNQCLLVDPAGFNYIGGPSRVVASPQQVDDFNELQNDLGTSVAVSGDYGMFSNSPAASYLRQAQTDDYSTEFYYFDQLTLVTNHYQPQSFGINALTPFGQAQEAKDSTGQIFRTNCGDQVVLDTPLGEQLLATWKLNFVNQPDQNLFNQHIVEVMSHTADIYTAIEEVVQQYSLEGTMVVSAIQQGGDPTQLATQVFSSGTCSQGYCVSSCDLKNIESCNASISDILNYAASNYPNQISYKDGKIVAAVAIGYDFAPWAGVKTGTSLVTQEVVQARKELGDTYRQQLTQHTVLNHLINSPVVTPYWSDAYRAQVQAMDTALVSNVAALQNTTTGAAACYSNPVGCAGIAAKLLSSLKPIDPSLYSQFSSIYYVNSTLDPSTGMLVAPLGSNNYEIFAYATRLSIGQQTITPVNNGLHVAGSIGPRHFTGDLTEQSAGNYAGTITYSDGSTSNQTYQLMENTL